MDLGKISGFLTFGALYTEKDDNLPVLMWQSNEIIYVKAPSPGPGT